MENNQFSILADHDDQEILETNKISSIMSLNNRKLSVIVRLNHNNICQHKQFNIKIKHLCNNKNQVTNDMPTIFKDCIRQASILLENLKQNERDSVNDMIDKQKYFIRWTKYEEDNEGIFQKVVEDSLVDKKSLRLHLQELIEFYEMYGEADNIDKNIEVLVSFNKLDCNDQIKHTEITVVPSNNLKNDSNVPMKNDTDKLVSDTSMNQNINSNTDTFNPPKAPWRNLDISNAVWKHNGNEYPLSSSHKMDNHNVDSTTNNTNSNIVSSNITNGNDDSNETNNNKLPLPIDNHNVPINNAGYVINNNMHTGMSTSNNGIVIPTTDQDLYHACEIITKDLYITQLSNTAFDMKGFMTKDSFPQQGTDSFVNFYRRIVTHGWTYGIYIPPYESMEKDNFLGGWYEDLPLNVKRNIPRIATSLMQVLKYSDVISDKDIIITIGAYTNGYTALYQVIRSYHPRTQLNPVILPLPICKPQQNIHEYVSKWKDYLICEYQRGRTWSAYDVARSIIQNLLLQQSAYIMNKFDALIIAQGGNIDTIPTSFHMNIIAGTIQHMNLTNPQNISNNYTPPNHHTNKFSRALMGEIHDYDPDTNEHDFDYDLVHNALQSDMNKYCKICDSNSHDLSTCYKYINYCLCNKLAKQDPKSVSGILDKHKYIPKNNRYSRTKKNSHIFVNTDENDDDLQENVDNNLNHDQVNIVNNTEFQSNLDNECFNDPFDDYDENIMIHSIDVENPINEIIPSTDITYVIDVHHKVTNNDSDIGNSNAIGGQWDSGANVSTTNRIDILWNLHKLKHPTSSSDAGKNPHKSEYRGYVILPCIRKGKQGHMAILVYYTPSIQVTLISPNAIRKHTGNKYPKWILTDDGTTVQHTYYDNSEQPVLDISLYLHNGLHYTVPFVLPTLQQRKDPLPFKMELNYVNNNFIDDIVQHDDLLLDDDYCTELDIPDVSCSYAYDIDNINKLHMLYHDTSTSQYHSLMNNIFNSNTSNTLNARANYQLWHQRLGHLNPRMITDIHKSVDGVPHLSPPTILDSCPICIQSKMRRIDASHDNSRHATVCYQGLSIDMAFIVQKSKNSDRYIDNVGLNGETCYVLITDHFSGMLHGKVLVNKGPPLEWFNQWLARFSPDINNKTVRFDQGGELGRCKQIITLFQKYGYTIQLTGTDTSHQNGPVERSHQTLGNMMRSLLDGANLPKKFWPYAFYHSIFISNRVPHRDQTEPPITKCSGRRISLHDLRTFGCNVYVRLPGNRKAKLDSNIVQGTFLGYNDSLKSIYWYDHQTNRIKYASHVRFDEGMTDNDNPPPNVRLLQRIQHDGIPTEHMELDINPIDLIIDESPFRKIEHVQVTINCEHATFGLELGECHTRHRVYISDIIANTSFSNIRHARNKFIGAYVVQINDTLVYDVEDILPILQSLRIQNNLEQFTIVLALDRYIPVRNRQEPMRINSLMVHHVTTLRNEVNIDLESDHITTSQSENKYTQEPLSPTELSLKGKITRSKLKKLDTFSQWEIAERKQLDSHWNYGMFSKPMNPPSGAIILDPVKIYSIKNGERKLRYACNGSAKAAPTLHEKEQTYASCIEQPIAKLFCGGMTYIEYIILLTDAVNAYAHAPGPKTRTFLRVDPVFRDWYFYKFGILIQEGMVVEVLHALQGHPEAGRLWEGLVNKALIDDMGFRTTTHERNIYVGLFMGHQIYVLRQVDDLAVGAPNIEIGQKFIDKLGQYFTLSGRDLLNKFNGMEIEQSREYTRLHCTTYINKLLERHGWHTPSLNDINNTTVKDPMTQYTYKQLDIDIGPPIDTTEGKLLEKENGFSYRQLLGELMYAYVVCRLDIGYALTKLAQYSTNPALIHYQALKRIALYLRAHKDWGIIYWRPKPINWLPPGIVKDIPPEPHIENLPIHACNELVGYVDAAHATDNKRRSVTGYVITFCGAAVCYRSKVQTSVATSSTEAEFIAAVSAAKSVKYLRSVLKELGAPFTQEQPTTIYEDNAAAILIVNAGKPTTRTRHVDIQYFALQEWKNIGDIVMKHIPGIINISDALTKALGWILHHRHVRRAMGHHTMTYKLHQPYSKAPQDCNK